MRRLRRYATLFPAFVAAACSAIGFGGGRPDLAGTWTGSLQLEGQRIESSLVLTDGEDFRATFRAPSLRLEAAGEGALQGERLTLVLDYSLQCPGVLRLEGTVEPGERLVGSLEARDCTGTVLGTFSFRPGGR